MSEATPETVRSALEQIIAPLREQLELVETRETVLETERAQLRQLRQELTAALKAVAPEWAEERERIRKARTNGHLARRGMERGPQGGVSQEVRDDVYAWLEQLAPDYPEGLIASQLAKLDGAPPGGQSRLSTVMLRLQEDGRLRLDHVGKGNRKFYKLAERADR
jgi:hypothetical protein